MSIQKRWSKPPKAKNAPEKPGVYEWGNSKGNILKIGRGDPLKDRLTEQMPSKPKDVTRIRWSPARNAEKLEKQMLEEFKKKHGRLPKYNERIG